MNILVLCTGNSARSIILETILRQYSDNDLSVYSAGSKPTGQVHPLALHILQEMGLDTRDARSKSWNEFNKAPEMDIVITVCGNAANEVCPIWPGTPLRAHWGVEDPADPTLSEAQARQAFRDTFDALKARAELFLALPMGKLSRQELQQELHRIGDH